MNAAAALFVCTALAYAIATNMLTPLLPSLQQQYGIGPVAALWLTLSTLLGGALFVPSMCRLGDLMRWRKQIIVVALGCLTIGGALAAVSDSLELLIVARVITGMGAASTPMMTGIAAQYFTETRRKASVALISSGVFLGAGFGGTLASLLITRPDGFRILFWLTAAVPFAAMIAALLVVPKDPPAPADPGGGRRPRALDLPGAIGFIVPVAALVVAFSFAARWGWTSLPFFTLVVGGLVVFMVWTRVERRTRDPLVDISVFFSRPVLIANSASVLGGFLIFGSIASTSTIMQLPPLPGVGGLGTSAVKATLLILPAELMIVWMAPVVAILTRRYGKGIFLTVGPLVQAAGYLMLFVDHSGVGALFLGVLVIGTGTGISCSAWVLVYVDDIAPEHVGRVSAIAPILSQGVGGSISGAIFGAIVTSFALPKTGLPSIEAFEVFWLVSIGVGVAGSAVGLTYLRSFGRRSTARPEPASA
ncbi:MFS transporter [Streptomyces phaeochromogenes]|uniref:MFS transporter n=1 Tax=Streptomyces phaeochromogenes TaxID=1923 RepID=A0ABZ1HQA3_STRPH|nr:MFS transporter [Streptomyces phaeochromogenes]WSD19691.1 MFS transporter [Streptomyces phaeochromogenes]